MTSRSTGERILSYLTGQLVEKRASAISGELEVWYQNGRYVLHSPDANYSFDTLHKVFQQALKKLNIRKLNPQRVLVLGFGAGSVAVILRDELKLNPQITGVEIDPTVIALAEKYFGLGGRDQLKVEVADAGSFVRTCNENFDLVVSDVFVDKNIPEQMRTEEYAFNLVRLTRPSGIGLMNMIVETKQQRTQTENMAAFLKQAGATVETLRLSSINTMLVWKKRD